MADNDTTTKPFGPVAAVFTAAGIGAVVLGILTTLAEASASIKDALQLNDRVGPLSGKTIFAVLAFLILWAVFHALWKDKDPSPGKVFALSWILMAIGVLLTFPIFFKMFAAE